MNRKTKARRDAPSKNRRAKGRRGMAPLADEALGGVAGGASVHIDEVTSSVRTTDGGLLGPDLLGKLVGYAVEGIRAAAKRPKPQ